MINIFKRNSNIVKISPKIKELLTWGLNNLSSSMDYYGYNNLRVAKDEWDNVLHFLL